MHDSHAVLTLYFMVVGHESRYEGEMSAMTKPRSPWIFSYLGRRISQAVMMSKGYMLSQQHCIILRGSGGCWKQYCLNELLQLQRLRKLYLAGSVRSATRGLGPANTLSFASLMVDRINTMANSIIMNDLHWNWFGWPDSFDDNVPQGLYYSLNRRKQS